ncbi:MAG: hypothetical protein EXS14_00790 [Planctomycetes bacterium]|nr:hypothetical protein [Planctomycetota bacterium]
MIRSLFYAALLAGTLVGQGTLSGNEVLLLREIGVDDAGIAARVRAHGLVACDGLLSALEDQSASQELRDLAALLSPRRMALAELAKDFDEARCGPFSLLVPRGWIRSSTDMAGSTCDVFTSPEGGQRIVLLMGSPTSFPDATAEHIGTQVIEQTLRAIGAIGPTVPRARALRTLEGRVWASAAAVQSIPRAPARELSIAASIVAGRAVLCVGESMSDAQPLSRPMDVMLGTLIAN